MRSIQSIYLCGLGAVGATYAKAFLEFASGSLKVVADEGRIERYRKGGVYLNGERLDVEYLAPSNEAPPADLIIVAVKQHQLDEAVELIAPLVGKDTIILSFLNGIESEEIIGRRCGMKHLLYSFVVETDAVKAGNQIISTKTGIVVFGEEDSSAGSERVTAVRELFEQCGIRHRVPDDMIREMWWKFMLNVGANQVSAVLRCGYGGFVQSPHTQEAMRMACREVVHLAATRGVSLRDEDIEKCFEIFGRLAPEGKTSMLQDVDAGRRTEVELFAGTVGRLGRELGVATPVNDLLYELILSNEEM
ncbi:ketopantoate reductase family protein [Phragmitibacter flavus]|uniref:2-dehydropantoate 2-reductase n=1 Tax=Phragmitibacter flavus TaxID=2576071 RepID=A0A5R8K9U5_9BACT|nr:ketopantoate reductase family protein [Phragmitibacter flavus]TLD69080.1 ketopantoate reductase family protein [Phragmitibacter flavus]